MKKSNPKALMPIGVFLVLYLGLGIVFEYVMKIPMGFYNIPIVLAFMVAILVACFQNREVSFDDKLSIMAQGLADKNIITMLLIFLVAGSFVGVVGRSSAESVAYFMLSLIPAKFSVAVLFVVACFVSTAMGTSVGTITLIAPIAAAVSDASGFDLALCIGSVMGGAMFGDNLSFISDTTIAACNGQGCPMKDKFRENFWIAFPAALVTLGMGLLVAAMDIATANNTVAIVMANPIAVEMSEEYGITHSKAASLLDTFSCISQGVIPYGAQMLVALSAIHEMGHELSAFDVIPKLFYPGLLLVSSLIFIFIIPQKEVS